MAKAIKDKLEETGHKVAEAATRVGHKVGEQVEAAADWTKEKAKQVGNRVNEAAEKVEHKFAASTESRGPTGLAANIRKHQQVDASCGTKVGTVDRVDGNMIKLTKHDSPDGQHHLIPLSWVASVQDHVHLDRDHLEVQRQWQPA